MIICSKNTFYSSLPLASIIQCKKASRPLGKWAEGSDESGWMIETRAQGSKKQEAAWLVPLQERGIRCNRWKSVLPFGSGSYLVKDGLV